MSVLQVVLQQLGGPDRGMITRLAGIASEGRRNPGVDDLGDRRGAARPRGVEQACPELEVVAPEEAVDPVVDGLTADLERLGDLLGGEPLGEPEHRLGATPLLGRRGPEHEVFQFPQAADPPIGDPQPLSRVSLTITCDFVGPPPLENKGKTGGL